MSKIQELIHNNNTILVFDVDGTLAKMEYGEYNHFDVDDDTWTKLLETGVDMYPNESGIPTMVNYMSNKNMDNIYVCSKSYSDIEDKLKIRFLKDVYHIKENNIYFVRDDKNKLSILDKIKEENVVEEDYKIALVDDSLVVLTYVKENSNYSTIHISSFM